MQRPPLGDEPWPWRAERTGDGAWTLRQLELDETCHSRSGAWQQARERYALATELGRHGSGGAVRLLDIGTGLGLNLAAALWAFEREASAPSRLEIDSFEVDPRVLVWAARLTDWPEDVERYHALLRPLLLQAARAQAGSHSASLSLRGGDKQAHVQIFVADASDAAQLAPERKAMPGYDAVFLDPFSPRALARTAACGSDLWSEAFLAHVAMRMRSPAMLSTYSCAVRVRLGLLRAGLAVGSGPRVGSKSSGTLASKGLVVPPLQPRTARRLARRLGRPLPALGAAARGDFDNSADARISAPPVGLG